MFCHCPLLLLSRLSVFWGIHEASSSTWTPPDQEALAADYNIITVQYDKNKYPFDRDISD